MSDTLAAFVFVFLIVVGSLVAGFFIASTQCANVAEKMKVPYSYQLLQGCMIEPKPGQWVPLKNYRVL